MKKEKKMTYSYYCKPSIRKKAMNRAKREGGNLSEIIQELLIMYNDSPQWKSVSNGKAVNTLSGRTIIDSLLK